MRAFLVAALALSFAAVAPASAQTFSAGSKALPATTVVPMPQTFGVARPKATGLDRPVHAGEYATRVHTVRDRIALMAKTQAARHARETALIAKRGAGVPVPLQAARY